MRIFIIGFMGSGKSTVAQLVAGAMDCRWIDLDSEIEKSSGLPVFSLFEEKGEEPFRLAEKTELEKWLGENDFVMSCGGGTPCFYDNLVKMKNAGKIIYLHASSEELFTRLQNEKENRPLLKGKTQDELKLFIYTLLEKRKKFYEQADHIVSSGNTPQITAEKIINVLKAQ
ncbi:MAG: shikimate kinase [Bacteroidota bacterium]